MWKICLPPFHSPTWADTQNLLNIMLLTEAQGLSLLYPMNPARVEANEVGPTT
jgi:hypothetical protein